MSIIICDIDNCIANDEWRIPHIDWSKEDPDARYHIYHSLSVQDRSVMEWLKTLHERHNVQHVHFFTARSLRYRDQTLWWLEKQWPMMSFPRGNFTLHMRNLGDHRHSVELKRDMLADVMESPDVMPDDVVGAFDDRMDVVKMYLDCGIRTARQVAIHDTCAYNRPLPTPQSVPDILRSGADTYEARNKVYGDNYKRVGAVMAALFPDGVKLQTAEQFNQRHLFELMVVKMTRFTNSGLEHGDSIHDLQVYAAMVQSLIKKGTFT